MAAYVKTLKSGSDIIYPQTKTSGVFDENNVNLQTVLDDMSGSIQSFVGKRITSDYNVTKILSVGGWSNNTQTISNSNIGQYDDVIVSPISDSIDDYVAAGIRCTNQAAGSLTFTCTTTPSSAIYVNILVLSASYLGV